VCPREGALRVVDPVASGVANPHWRFAANVPLDIMEKISPFCAVVLRCLLRRESEQYVTEVLDLIDGVGHRLAIPQGTEKMTILSQQSADWTALPAIKVSPNVAEIRSLA
jgi:hypothetical protein